MWDWNLSAMRIDHATVGMLSDRAPTLENCIYTSFCSTTHCKITAAIYESEFIKRPCGLCSETTSLEMTS